MTQYSDWQQSVDGPDEYSQEDEVAGALAELLTTYGTIQELANALCAVPIDVIHGINTGTAADGLIASINRLMNEGEAT